MKEKKEKNEKKVRLTLDSFAVVVIELDEERKKETRRLFGIRGKKGGKSKESRDVVGSLSWLFWDMPRVR